MRGGWRVCEEGSESTHTQVLSVNPLEDKIACHVLYQIVLKRIYRIFGYSFVNVFVRLQTNIRLFIV